MKKRLGVLAGLAVAAAACSGGSNNGAVPFAPGASGSAMGVIRAAATPTPSATLPAEVVTSPGKTDGSPGHFTPAIADSPTGGRGQTVDGIPCETTMSENDYHVHAFVGVLVNGNWLAIPYGVGMFDPGTPVNGFVNTAHCFYYIHTHDESGYVHFESPSKASLSSSLYNLGNVLDVWGQTISSTSFASWPGTVHVYYGKVPLGQLVVSSYSEYTGDPRALSLYSHEAVWIEVGTPVAKLPPVRFYTEY